MVGRGDACRHVAVLYQDVVIFVNANTGNARNIALTRDGAVDVQVADDGVVTSNMLEGGHGFPILVEIDSQRMSAAVECAAEVSCALACRLGDADVSHQLGIDVILAFGIFHHVAEGVPVGSSINHVRMLGRIRYLHLLVVSHLGSDLTIGILCPAAA